MDCSRSRDANAIDDVMNLLPSGERLIASRSGSGGARGVELSRAGGSRVKRTLDGEHHERRLGRDGGSTNLKRISRYRRRTAWIPARGARTVSYEATTAALNRSLRWFRSIRE